MAARVGDRREPLGVWCAILLSAVFALACSSVSETPSPTRARATPAPTTAIDALVEYFDARRAKAIGAPYASPQLKWEELTSPSALSQQDPRVKGFCNTLTGTPSAASVAESLIGWAVQAAAKRLGRAPSESEVKGISKALAIGLLGTCPTWAGSLVGN